MRYWIAVAVLACSIACCAIAQDRPAGAGVPWPMHHIHDDYLIANSLQAGDVNADGFTDYAVIDESVGLQTIVFHPGTNGDVRAIWPRGCAGSMRTR